MSEYNSEHRCPDCDGTGGNHYPGCVYDGTDSNYRPSRCSGGGMSTLGAIMCIIGSLFGVALIFTVLDVDVENVPAFVIVILWIIVASVIAGVVSAFKGRQGFSYDRRKEDEKDTQE